MSNAPVSESVAEGFEPPRNVQFSVFLDQHVGRLLDLMDVFAGHALTLAGLSVVDSADHAVVRILTSRSDLARRLLLRRNLHFSETDVLAVELGRGKTIAEICRSLLSAEINIHFAYPLLVRPRGLPAVVLHADDAMLSAQILRRKHFTLLAENDMGDHGPRSAPRTPTDPWDE